MPDRASTSMLVPIAHCSTSRPAPLRSAAAGRTTLSSRKVSLGTTCAGRAPARTFWAGSSSPVCRPLRTIWLNDRRAGAVLPLPV